MLTITSHMWAVSLTRKAPFTPNAWCRVIRVDARQNDHIWPLYAYYLMRVSVKNKTRYTRRMAIANGTCVSWVVGRPTPPRTIAVNVTWMRRGFNACQKHRSMYPSIFNRFPVIQPVSSKVRNFSTFFAFACLAHFDFTYLLSSCCNSCCK